MEILIFILLLGGAGGVAHSYDKQKKKRERELNRKIRRANAFSRRYGLGIVRFRKGGSRSSQPAQRRESKQQRQIKQLKNENQQLKRINKSQKPMADSGVSTGTYRLYQAGLKDIAKLTWKQQRLIFTMPEIRTVVEGLLGIPEGSTTKKYAPKKYR